MALNLPLPKKVYGHGWLLLDGGKMSKSKGNIVDPVILCNRYGVDAVRYFLLREVPFGSDGNFSNEALINRINSDLANDLGNLVARSTSMVDKYFSGNIPADRVPTEFDQTLISLAQSTKALVEKYLDNLEYSAALTELFRLVSRTNKYIDETTPWTLAKSEENTGKLASVMYNLCEAMRIIAVLLTPFLPSTSAKIAEKINAGATITDWNSADHWGLLSGEGITKAEPLFPRIDVEKELAALENE